MVVFLAISSLKPMSETFLADTGNVSLLTKLYSKVASVMKKMVLPDRLKKRGSKIDFQDTPNIISL